MKVLVFDCRKVLEINCRKMYVFTCFLQEKRILELGDDPYIGTEPRYLVLKRQGYKVLILEKDLVFYKIDEENKAVVIYAVVDQRQDYLNIIRGL